MLADRRIDCGVEREVAFRMKELLNSRSDDEPEKKVFEYVKRLETCVTSTTDELLDIEKPVKGREVAIEEDVNGCKPEFKAKDEVYVPGSSNTDEFALDTLVVGTVRRMPAVNAAFQRICQQRGAVLLTITSHRSFHTSYHRVTD